MKQVAEIVLAACGIVVFLGTLFNPGYMIQQWKNFWAAWDEWHKDMPGPNGY